MIYLKLYFCPVSTSEIEAGVVIEALASRLSEVDQLDQTLATSLQQAEALRQSILKKAFAGLLVPQDPHDEPASKLLARIQVERAVGAKNAHAAAKTLKQRGVSNLQKMHTANFSYPEIPGNAENRKGKP